MKFSAINFTCSSCGAPQKFTPITGTLTCEFCGTQTQIENNNLPIEEYNFKAALSTLKAQHSKEMKKEVKCQKCGGSFTLTPYSFSSNCPFCDTPAITHFVRQITPKSLIPFQIGYAKAKTNFAKWIDSRWFAPSAFKKHLDDEEKLIGYYLPYWTYDSDTMTSYSGLRGDTYYVTVSKTVVENGRQRQVRVQESRIRWTPKNGTVYVSFDDVTIGASKTISRSILDSLEPWDTQVLVNFDEKYLSGFEAEEYTIGLDNGFEFAKMKMVHKIDQNIRNDIGGDTQQITSLDTQYSNISYKNILLPIWTASFVWKKKTYHYAINAQTGKISGERPYSYLKIGLLVFLILGAITGLIYFDSQ